MTKKEIKKEVKIDEYGNVRKEEELRREIHTKLSEILHC
jgi:hypothetical protein